MSSHANCTHEKTKAARAACRAGRPVSPAASATDPSPRARLREKAASTKLGEPKSESVDLGKTMSAGAKIYMSGHCSTHNHDRCIGIYALTPCTCPCHSPNNAG